MKYLSVERYQEIINKQRPNIPEDVQKDISDLILEIEFLRELRIFEGYWKNTIKMNEYKENKKQIVRVIHMFKKKKREIENSIESMEYDAKTCNFYHYMIKCYKTDCEDIDVVVDLLKNIMKIKDKDLTGEEFNNFITFKRAKQRGD